MGQNFPDDPGSVGVQVFYLTVGLLGVASFALVLALIEQVVLDGFEANVRKGSAVYESNHVRLAQLCVFFHPALTLLLLVASLRCSGSLPCLLTLLVVALMR